MNGLIMGFFDSSFQYFNGNYIVRLDSRKKFFKLEKRALRVDEELISEFPDSIDLKITDKCNHGCPFCHESSTPKGKSLDLIETKRILSQLPKKPIEIAIGGGNVIECMDELEDLCDWLRIRNHRPRITLNVRDLMGSYLDPKNERIVSLITGKIGGLGVSLNSLDFIHEKVDDFDPLLKKKYFSQKVVRLLDRFPMGYEIGLSGTIIVYHIIAGIFPISELDELLEKIKDECLLILGYKQWGRAKNDNLPNMEPWKEKLREILERKNTNLNYIGFDNLACEQLDIKNLVGEDIWKQVYFGDEGSCSMYIDAVRGEFARTSRSSERVSWNKIGLLDYYASLRK